MKASKVILAGLLALMLAPVLGHADTPTATPTASPTITLTSTPTASPTVTPTASPTATPTYTPAVAAVVSVNGVTVVTTSPCVSHRVILNPSVSAAVTIKLYDGTGMADTYVAANLRASFTEDTTDTPTSVKFNGVFKKGIVASTTGSGTPNLSIIKDVY